MPSQGNRISYPCSVSYRGMGKKLHHHHQAAWINAIKGRKGRRIFLKHFENEQEKIYWLNITVLKEMIKWLEDDPSKPYGKNYLRGLKKNEAQMLFGKPRKERGQEE